MIFVLGLFLFSSGLILFCMSVGMYIGICGNASKLQQFVGVGVAIISVISFFYGVYLVGVDGLTLMGVI